MSFAQEGVIFFVKEDKTKHKIEVRAKETLGHGIFKNDKFVHFVPISSRADLKNMNKALKGFGLNPKQLAEVEKYTHKVFESQLKPATTKDLIKTSVALSEVANQILDSELEIDCHEENGETVALEKEKEKKEKTAQVYCECELPKGTKGKVDKASAPELEGSFWDNITFLGDLESQEFSLDTSNDNIFHGLWRNIADPEMDGNDRGRTFGLNLNYSLKGSEGEFRIMYESTIFTQLKETSPGSNRFYVRNDGDSQKYLQDLLERNRLDISLRKKLDNSDLFLIGGVELEQLTDDGNMSGPIQTAWHSAWGKDTVQYENQDFMDDKYSLSLYGGVGKDWFHDLGKWKCRTRLEGTIGHNILDSSDTYAKVRGEVEFNSNEVFGGNEDNPYFLVSMWAEGSVESQGGSNRGAGINLSMPTNVGRWQIKPTVGFSIKDEKEDRFFSQKQSKKIEPESHIGITFTRRF